MMHAELGYIIIGIGEYNLLLPQEDVAAVRESAETAGRQQISYAGVKYTLRSLPDELSSEAQSSRYLLLLQCEAASFALHCERFTLLPRQHALSCFAVPAGLYDAQRAFVSALALHQQALLCITSATALERISSQPHA